MKLKAAFALAVVVFGAWAKADVVVLQNLNTTGQTTVAPLNLATNIWFSTSSAPSSLSKIILFGASGQTGITATFKYDANIKSNAISATEIASGQYAFNLVGVPGLSNIANGGHHLELRDFIISSGSGFYSTTNATMTTVNSSGFVGTSYSGNNLQFQLWGDSATAVPEPSTLILTASALAAGAVGAWVKRRRQKAAEASSLI